MDKPDPVGGQALIEGVMMRGKNRVSVALRRKNKEIQERVDQHVAYRERFFLFKLWIFRGAVTLIEALVLGIRYLSFSADMAMEDEKGEKKKKTFKDTLATVFSMVLAFGLALLLFMYFPLFLSDFIKKDQNPALFNFTAGIIRVTLFLLYVWAISKMKDIRRVFEYHGAEHKTIFAYEAKEEIIVENVRKYATRHPRCGTSFLLIGALSCIFVFAIVDFFYVSQFGPYASALHRFLVHLPMIPLLLGISYEVLRFSARFRDNPVIGKLTKPGLWLQRITTQEPDDAQIEVAIAALKGVL
jgi:uncharacterized protein YqhQ